MRNIIGGQIGYDNFIKKKLNFLKNNKIYPNGRSALYFILKEIKNRINKIYVPFYLCESILQPIKELNLKYEFYNIKKNFSYNLPNKNNSAIIFIDYFGRENKKTKKLKNNFKKNIFYIQDCTHTVFQKSQNLGNFNKKNIFRFASIKKYIPFPLGAISNIDKISLRKNTYKEKIIFNNIFETLKKRNKYFLKINDKIDCNFEKKILKQQNKFKLYECKKIFKSEIPLDIKKKILHYDLNTILDKRDKNFSIFKKKLNKKIKIISKNKNYPLNFTILTSKVEKIKIINYANKFRIFPSTLWPLPAEIRKMNYDFPKNLNSRILSFPIDHRYKKKDIEFIVSIIHKALRL